MKTNKKDKHYIPILDQPIEKLKKTIGDKVDFNAVMSINQLFYAIIYGRNNSVGLYVANY